MINLEEIIKLGIAGYGKMGKIREESINDSSGAIVSSIYEKNEDLIEDKTIFCKSFEELLNSDVDAVVISTYVNSAAEYVLKALEKGKHVFLKKQCTFSLLVLILKSPLIEK